MSSPKARTVCGQWRWFTKRSIDPMTSLAWLCPVTLENYAGTCSVPTGWTQPNGLLTLTLTLVDDGVGLPIDLIINNPQLLDYNW